LTFKCGAFKGLFKSVVMYFYLYYFQAQGEEFWALLQQPPYAVNVESSLKEVLMILGYSSLRTFVQFGSADVEKMQNFMRTGFIKCLEKKCEKEKIDLNEQLLKFYGPLWRYCPESYEVFGGHEKVLTSIAEIAAKVSKPVSVILSKPVQPRKKSLTRQRLDPTADEAKNILKEKKRIEQLLNDWMEKKLPESLRDPEDLLPQVTVKVAPNNMGSYIAEVQCPFSNEGGSETVCTYKCTTHFKDGRWFLSNFYRHVESQHITTPKKNKQGGKGNQTLFQAFNKSNGKTPEEHTHDVPDDTQSESNKDSSSEGESSFAVKRRKAGTSNTSPLDSDS